MKLKPSENTKLYGMNHFFNEISKLYNDKKMPTNSTMGNKSSDIIGGLKIIPNEYLKFDYDFSLDSDLKTSNYNLLKSTVSINNFVTSFEFMEELNEKNTITKEMELKQIEDHKREKKEK